MLSSGWRLVLILLAMLAAMAFGVTLAFASWEVLGPLLEGRSDLLQGMVGAGCGLLAASPSLLIRAPRTRRRAEAPTLWWLLAAATGLLIAIPFRRGGLSEAAAFGDQAGMYAPISVAVFLVVTVVVLRRMPADASRPTTDGLAGPVNRE